MRKDVDGSVERIDLCMVWAKGHDGNGILLRHVFVRCKALDYWY